MRLLLPSWEGVIIQKILANCSPPPIGPNVRTGCGSVNPIRSYWLLWNPRVRSWGQSATRLISLKTKLIVSLAFAKLPQLFMAPKSGLTYLVVCLQGDWTESLLPSYSGASWGVHCPVCPYPNSFKISNAFPDHHRQSEQFSICLTLPSCHTAEPLWTNEWPSPSLFRMWDKMASYKFRII